MTPETFDGRSEEKGGGPFGIRRPVACDYQNLPRRPTMIVRPESNSVNTAPVNC
jgi:hypothetical protein